MSARIGCAAGASGLHISSRSVSSSLPRSRNTVAATGRCSSLAVAPRPPRTILFSGRLSELRSWLPQSLRLFSLLHPPRAGRETTRCAQGRAECVGQDRLEEIESIAGSGYRTTGPADFSTEWCGSTRPQSGIQQQENSAAYLNQVSNTSSSCRSVITAPADSPCSASRCASARSLATTYVPSSLPSRCT